jgi:pyrimidine deaminase RibD-like protein
MKAALLEGRKALPLCLPNPPVGCILVQDDIIVASGHTQPPGQYHAEAMALSQISGDLASIAAYVTLEPCSFHGRTPSCAKALVASGIKQVFVAMLDPDPRNAGAGIQILRDGGIEVSIGLLEYEAHLDLDPYLLLDSSQHKSNDPNNANAAW